jgi:putative transposase
VDQDYTNGLSLWQHKVIKREARANVKDYVDIVDLCLAKDRIQKMVDEGFNAQSKSSSNVKAALWESVGKVEGRIETSSREADNEHSTASTREARLVPPVNSDAEVPRLQNALPTSALSDDTAVGESGIEILKGKRGNPRKTTSKPKQVDNSTSAKQQTHTTETDTNPFTHEHPESLLEEDMDLEGWETGHDLPTRKR